MENFVLDYNNIICENPVMKNNLNIIHQILNLETTVMLLGESGTGKDFIAQYIHYNSNRRQHPFVSVSCSAMNENLIETELFGITKGAFTGAVKDKKGKFLVADKGTIFLDEIADINIKIQSKLLRVIQEKKIQPVGSENEYKVNVRIIASTSKNLDKLVEQKKFREDLYYRLNIIKIELPPLRKRKEDIPLLIKNFCKIFNMKYNKNVEFSKQALQKLTNHHWKGNIRELSNYVERLIVLSDSNRITPTDINFYDKSYELDINDLNYKNCSLKEAEHIFKKEFLLHKLKENNWNVTETSKQLDIQRTYLSKLIAKYSLKDNN